AFITSRIDFCNALLSCLPKNTIKFIQLIQNSASRTRREHITPILKSSHWLPVSFRIDFKMILLVYKALHGLAPGYLSEIFVSFIY
ncbi:hypothetical protein LDENG_00073460, partial [Lucifuga dentata]